MRRNQNVYREKTYPREGKKELKRKRRYEAIRRGGPEAGVLTGRGSMDNWISKTKVRREESSSISDSLKFLQKWNYQFEEGE